MRNLSSRALLQVWQLLMYPLVLCINCLCYRKTSNMATGRPKCKIKLLLTVPLVILVPYMYIQLTFPVRYIFKHSNTSSACVIPHPDPFDPSILKFVWHPDPLVCDASKLPVIHIDERGLVQFNKSALDMLSVDQSNTHCKYSILDRHIDDDNVILSNPVDFTPPIHVDSDFFKVTCESNGKVIFDRLLTNIRKTVNRTGPEVEDESRDHLSVIVFGVDSVSRSAAIRKLPKTFKYLTEDLQSYDFKGHVKVGENTLPNLVPFLTGRAAWSDELPITDYATEPYDPFPLLWKNFSSQGYATFFSEDDPSISTFNYLTKGFVNPPADHYMRPFMLGVKKEKGSISKVVQMFLENQNIQVNGGSTFCYGDKPLHVIQTDYLKQFIQRYSGKRKFAFSFINEITHDYPNFLEYADDTILQLLQWMKAEGHLDNCAFILFSDHGARIDKIRNTFVGRIEDRMPVFELVLPAHVRSRFPRLHANLLTNTNRLSTHYDTHQTLMDILFKRFSEPTKSYIKNRLRSISLFGELPVDRSCADARIHENYCVCYTETPIDDHSDALLGSLTSKVIDTLNDKFKGFPGCAKLSLNKVMESRSLVHGLQHRETENTGISIFQFFQPEVQAAKRYFIVIETKPGLAAFEATLTTSAKSVVDIVGEPIRVNKYGNQSSCINEKRLKPYCYCVQ